jgi:hypothetical protein
MFFLYIPSASVVSISYRLIIFGTATNVFSQRLGDGAGRVEPVGVGQRDRQRKTLLNLQTANPTHVSAQEVAAETEHQGSVAQIEPGRNSLAIW